MQDGIAFQLEVARFHERDVTYIVDLLRCVYKIRTAQSGETDDILEDFIDALETADSIEIVEKKEFLVDAD